MTISRDARRDPGKNSLRFFKKMSTSVALLNKSVYMVIPELTVYLELKKTSVLKNHTSIKIPLAFV